MADETKLPETTKQKKAREKAAEARDEVLRGFREAVRTGEGLAKAEEDLKKYRNTLHTMTESTRAASEAIYENSTSFKDLNAAVRLRNQMMQDEIAHLQTSLDLTKDKIATLREALGQEGLSEEQKRNLTEALIALTKQQTEQESSLKKSTEQQKAFNRVGEQTKAIVSSITGVSDRWKQTLLGSITATGSLKNGLLAMGAAYQEAFTAGNIMGSTMMKIQESTMALAISEDKAAVSLRAFNNETEDQIDASLAAARTNRSLGVSTSELIKVKTELYQTTLSFSKMSQEEQNQLAVTMETLDRFGVSSSLAAKNTSFLMDTMGMSGKEVERYQKRMAHFAQSIGKNLKMVNDEMAKVSSTIVKYGNTGMDVFEKLSATAKSLKTDVGQLTGAFEDQFNTFEGAFTTVGRLNSIMLPYGKQLDAMAMMHSDVADRAAIMTEFLHGTELAYNALNGPLSKYYLQMIANAMQTKDLDLVTKVLRGDLNDLGDTVAYATSSYEEFMSDEFMNKAQTQQDMMKKLKLAAEQFGAAMMPIIRYMTAALTTFNELMDEFDSLRVALGYIIGGFIVMKTVAMAWFVISGLINGVMAISTASFWKNSLSQEANSKSKLRNAMATKASAQAMMASVPAMIGFGIAAAGVGAAVLMAGMGIREISEGFKELDVTQMIGVSVALTLIGVGLYYIAPAIIAAAGSAQIGAVGLGLLAIAVMSVGAAIAIAAAGMGYLFESISKIKPETGLGILMVAAALGVLGGVLVAMGASAILGVIGLGIMLPLVLTLGSVMERITSPERVGGLQAFSELMTTLAQTDLEKLGDNLERIADILDRIGMATVMVSAIVGPEVIGTVLTGATQTATESKPIQPAQGARPEDLDAAKRQAAPPKQDQASSQTNAALTKAVKDLTDALKLFKDRPVRLQLTGSGQDEFIAEVKEAIGD